jgi:benzoyl-CoA reductase subunit C
VIRNLSGMWKVLYPGLYVRYLDLPQVRDPALATRFWVKELQTLVHDLGELSGAPADEAALRSSLGVFNEARQLIRELYRARREAPWRVPSEELYLLLRAGEVVAVEDWLEKARGYLKAAENDAAPIKDRSRVVVVGAFCEQPPLGLIKTIERAGCYIVDDDFLLGNRLLSREVPLAGDPLTNLAQALVHHAVKTSVLYEPNPQGKRNLMKERVEAAGADGIIFAAASFCDPALLDRPMLRAGAEAHGIPCIAFKYAENSGQFQQFREQAGTFADAIKLWGGVSA